jgi:hypothetical protein
MSVEATLVDANLRAWNQALERLTKLFSAMNSEEFEREIAPGKNRLIYIYGHLLAVSDAMYSTLRLGDRLYPELDGVFLKAADRSVTLPPATELQQKWAEVHERLSAAMAALTPAEWIERHASVSEEDFAKEPHRNRLALLLSRTWHLGYHTGQIVLVKK